MHSAEDTIAALGRCQYGLEIGFGHCEGCPYFKEMTCRFKMARDAYKLLKKQKERIDHLDAYLCDADAADRIAKTVDNHMITLYGASKIVEACAPYCDEKTVDGFIQWLKSHWNGKAHILRKEAIENPRVMLQTEVFMENNALYEGCVWLETRYGGLAPCFIGFMYQGELKVYSPYLHPGYDTDVNETWWSIASYGESWRCWTSRPSDKQREAEKWDDKQ